MKLLGILLIIAGVLALVYQGVTYTERDTVADIGPVEIVEEDTETVPLPPILGALALAGGIVLVIAGRNSP